MWLCPPRNCIVLLSLDFQLHPLNSKFIGLHLCYYWLRHALETQVCKLENGRAYFISCLLEIILLCCLLSTKALFPIFFLFVCLLLLFHGRRGQVNPVSFMPSWLKTELLSFLFIFLPFFFFFLARSSTVKLNWSNNSGNSCIILVLKENLYFSPFRYVLSYSTFVDTVYQVNFLLRLWLLRVFLINIDLLSNFFASLGKIIDFFSSIP